MSSRDYVLTTPVRDERDLLPRLVDNVRDLAPRPDVWVIVDDGSRDGSLECLESRAEARPWMILLPAPEQADEYLGAHVARIKRWGLEQALKRARELGLAPLYAGVLDADISLPIDHYERLIRAFEEDPKLGVTSSLIASREKDGARVERFQQNDLPRGPTQFFRVACLEEIGGLPPWPGFDGAANAKAQSLGWRTRLVRDVVAIQERETATRYGHAEGYARKGRYAWFLGLHPILVAVRSLAYSLFTPRTAGWHFFRGWLADAWNRRPRCPDPAVRRHYGRRRLFRVVRGILATGPRFFARRPSPGPVIGNNSKRPRD